MQWRRKRTGLCTTNHTVQCRRSCARSAVPQSRTVDVRLESEEDLYGSPSIDETSAFTRALLTELEATLGLEAAGVVGGCTAEGGGGRCDGCAVRCKAHKPWHPEPAAAYLLDGSAEGGGMAHCVRRLAMQGCLPAGSSKR